MSITLILIILFGLITLRQGRVFLGDILIYMLIILTMALNIMNIENYIGLIIMLIYVSAIPILVIIGIMMYYPEISGNG